MKVIEHIKTVLFIGLFVSAVTMAGIYIAAQPRTAAAGGDLPADVLSALRGGTGSAAARLEQEQLLPEFLGIKPAGKQAVGLLNGAAMLRDLTEALAPWCGFALGEGTAAEPLSSSASDRCWRECMAADAYFYFNWRFAVPAAVLRAHSLPEDSSAMLEMAEGTLPRIAEIFFFPNLLDGDVCAVSRDAEGVVTRWHRVPTAEDALPGFADFAIYLERGVLKAYTFAGAQDSDCPSTLLTLPVPDEPLSLPMLAHTHPFAGTGEDDRVSAALLGLFSYNPNKASSYYEGDTDTVVFVETHGTLRASLDSLVYEAAEQGGLAVADLVRKSDSTLNLRDDIMACEGLVDQLRQTDADCIGGDAVPQLTVIGTQGDTLVLEYTYAYNNVTVAQSVPALRLTVRGHRIIEVSVAVCCYRAGETVVRIGSQQWMLNLADHLYSRDGTACRIDLHYAIDTDPARLRADWTLDYLDRGGER